MEKRFKTLKKISKEDSELYVSDVEDFKNSFLCFYTIESLANGWDKINYFTKRYKRSFPSQGQGKEIIYIMSNPTYPGLLKIGYTGREVELRRVELSKFTGVPTPFKVEYIYRLHGRGEEMEREVHHYLGPQRNSSRKEFFEIKLDEAIKSIEKIGKNYL